MLASLLAAALLMATQPIVIAHRGASGERPEHTIEAYELAIAQGADFIEPDLVLTKDGVLVARHENEISGTTDVADKPAFAARRTTKTIDGQAVTGWFTEDFTLAELKTLRAKERLPQLRPANTAYDGKFEVPTFEEVLRLLAAHRARTGKRVGIYPETKHPAYFDAIGLSHDAPLLRLLSAYDYDDASDPVFIQSFEVGNLKRLNDKTKSRLIQLMQSAGGPADDPTARYATMATPAGLKAVAAYADGIGVEKAMIVPRDAEGGTAAPTSLVADAHAAGLLIHAWTFRAENVFLPAELRRGESPAARGDLEAELKLFYRAGVDGVFSDFPGAAVAAGN